MQRVFIGSEAVATGAVTKYQLRAHCLRVFPDVYALPGERLSVQERAVAAFLWSRRRAVVTGLAASALHGGRWVDDHVPIELNYRNNKVPSGILSRDETLLDDEVQMLRALQVTTPTRTAFDLARRGTRAQAVARLDALANTTHFKVDDVKDLLPRHPHLRGIRRVCQVLDLVDAGAQSPKETWLRLLHLEAGFPRPQTQIPILGPDGHPRYYLDMGWPEVMVAAEYDGEHHRVDRYTYTNDIVRSEYIRDIGWLTVRVVAGNRKSDIIERTRRAWALSQTPVR